MARINRLASEKSPYLLQHAHNPVDWYPWGTEAFEKARRRGQAHLPLHRLLHLPLVPRHGARVLRKRGSGRDPQRVLRPDQGGPRGAARRRSHLHAHRAGHHRRRRLAHVGLADARPRAVLRRHLLPAGDSRYGRPGFRQHAPSRSPRPGRARPREDCGLRPAGCWSRLAAAELGRGGDSERREPDRDGARQGFRALARRTYDRRVRRLRRAPKFPRPPLNFLLRYWHRTGQQRGPRHGAATLRKHGPRRHERPARRRLPPLLGRRSAGSCRTSRRCSTTRRSSPSSTWRPSRSPATRVSPDGARHLSTTSCAT